MAVTAYGVLSRGLLTGATPSSAADYRAHLPRFAGENRAQNQRLIETLHRLAGERGLAPATLAIAWVRAKGARIVPVMGARTRTQLRQTLDALQVTLSPQEVAQLEQAVPAAAVAGTRYQVPQMQVLDSER
jgi:aryl-alcohol dehydrogenase-like predicted oxidoreductase